MGCYSSKPDDVMDDEQSAIDKEAMERSRKALRALLASKDREFLVDRSGKKVKVDQLKGHTVGLLFSAHAVPAAREFIHVLGEVHKELRSKGRKFEVVFLSNDESQEIWKESMKKMPWLAVPYSDRDTGDNLGAKFSVCDIPTLIFVDADGNNVCSEGVEVVQSFGSKAWPFSLERLQVLRSEHEQQQVNGKDSRRPLDLENSHGNGKMGHVLNRNETAPRESQVAPEQ